VANEYDNNNVQKLMASDASEPKTIGVGTESKALAFNGANIWVTSGVTDVRKL